MLRSHLLITEATLHTQGQLTTMATNMHTAAAQDWECYAWLGMGWVWHLVPTCPLCSCFKADESTFNVMSVTCQPNDMLAAACGLD